MASKKATKGILQNLDSTPDSPLFDAHIWVDYLELLCLINIDGQLSIGDVLDRFRDRKDITGFHNLGDLTDPSATSAENRDRERGKVGDWFTHLSYRAGILKTSYPFSLDSDGSTLLRKDSLTDEQKLYVFFLLASNLRYVTKAHVLTKNFEQVSLEALKTCLPAGVEAHIFGTSAQVGSKYYGGTLFDRIRQLANDIGEKATPEEADYSPHNTADDGLDLVAWVPMGDQLNSRPLIFGQCACTADWISKQHTSGFDHWRQRINLKAHPHNMIFIPFFFRRVDGNWHKPQDITAGVLVDRLRLIHLLRQKVKVLSKMPSYKLVCETLRQEDPLF